MIDTMTKVECWRCYRVFDDLKSVVRHCEDCWIDEVREKANWYREIADNLKEYIEERHKTDEEYEGEE